MSKMSKCAMYALDGIAGFEITALHVYEIQLKRLYRNRHIFSELLIAYSEKDAENRLLQIVEEHNLGRKFELIRIQRISDNNYEFNLAAAKHINSQTGTWFYTMYDDDDYVIAKQQVSDLIRASHRRFVATLVAEGK